MHQYPYARCAESSCNFLHPRSCHSERGDLRYWSACMVLNNATVEFQPTWAGLWSTALDLVKLEKDIATVLPTMARCRICWMQRSFIIITSFKLWVRISHAALGPTLLDESSFHVVQLTSVEPLVTLVLADLNPPWRQFPLNKSENKSCNKKMTRLVCLNVRFRIWPACRSAS